MVFCISILLVMRISCFSYLSVVSLVQGDGIWDLGFSETGLIMLNALGTEVLRTRNHWYEKRPDMILGKLYCRESAEVVSAGIARYRDILPSMLFASLPVTYRPELWNHTSCQLDLTQ